MKNQFADYETSKMLKDLLFDGMCTNFYEDDGTFKFNNGDEYKDGSTAKGNWLASNNKVIGYYIAPTWQQVKQWLWEKHKICFQLLEAKFEGEERKYYYNIFKETTEYEGKPYEQKVFGLLQWDVQYRNSPIESEIEAIKKSVEYLYRQK